MSRRRSKCDHESGLHRYKKYLTAVKLKPIWHCVDCSSRANFDMAIITNSARCHDCGVAMNLSLTHLHAVQAGIKLGIADGMPIVCGDVDCGARKEAGRIASLAAQREASLHALADKLTKVAIERLRVDIRSESEQDGEALLLSMMGASPTSFKGE